MKISLSSRSSLTANPLQSHSIVHAASDYECVLCSRTFRANSAMLIHLETSCRFDYWDTTQTQSGLMVFTKRNPAYYDIDCDATGPITCGCQEKEFSKVSALCQHLESETCMIQSSGRT